MSSTLPSKYSFLPWLRRGISAKISTPESFGQFTIADPPRASYNVKARIHNDQSSFDDVNKSLQIVGPGDVVGIDSRAIIKTEPANWITNFEPHLFPFIEFYEEDFPWRFSPAAPVGSKLRPWITLVVLKESEFTRGDILDGPLPVIEVGAGPESPLFPNPAQTWGWAHVQFNGNLGATGATDPFNSGNVTAAVNNFVNVVKQDPDKAYSRILCPRRLEPNTSYYAFLIPAYETGRLAGLGADDTTINDTPAQMPAFGIAHDQFHNRFPVYHEWFFKTGITGDFEYLVRQIMPRPVDERVGKRLMDVQNPGYNVAFTGTPPNNGTLWLEGALRAPDTVSLAYPWIASTNDYFKRLRDILNLSEDLNDATMGTNFYGSNNYASTEPIEDDPFVMPHIYGRWHALRRRVEDVGVSLSQNLWLNELNMDPRNRVVAGLGTEFVRRNQDLLMDKAWEQLGDVLEANRKLRWAQMAQQASAKAFGKHIENQSAEQHNGMTARMQARVKKTSTATHLKKTTTSAQPLATLDPAWRRVQRPQGPVLRKIDVNNLYHQTNDLVTRLADKVIETVLPKSVSVEMNFAPSLDLKNDVSRVRTEAVSSAIFKVSDPGDVTYTVGNTAEETDFKTALEPYKNYFLASNWVPFDSGPALDVADMQSSLNTELHPIKTIPKWVYQDISLPGPPPPPDKIVPVMAYPVIDKPMYETVRDLGVDYLVPNLNLIPNDTITLLETNNKFIESFIVGANHEMGRELLWREYPTDQRGSYFRLFWESADFVDTQGRSPEDLVRETYDVPEIHTWPSNTVLGAHDLRALNNGESNMVLVIRGELLKKFPNTVIYAQKAKYQPDPGGGSSSTARTSGSGGTETLAPGNEAARLSGGSNTVNCPPANLTAPRELGTEIRYPIFSAKVEPDITFIGFDLTTEEAKGDRTDPCKPGWFFVLMERPGETRFGVDEPPATTAGPLNTWADLNWQHIADANPTGAAPEFGNISFATEYINLAKPLLPSNNQISGHPVPWAQNSASLALIFYQQPVKIAIHAFEMIP